MTVAATAARARIAARAQRRARYPAGKRLQVGSKKRPAREAPAQLGREEEAVVR